MAITVKHTFVSAIPDSGDSSLVEPSDWNADHVLTGTVPISNGGTGASTANAGFNALAPSQTGNSGKYLTTDGVDTSWSVNPLGTVTSVSGTAPVNVATGTTTPVISLSSTGSGNVVLATGATQANPTISNYEDFTPTVAPSYAEGRVWYDSTEKALAFYNDSSALAVHVSQDLIVKVINNTGSTIANGSPVYVTGTSSGQTYPNVALARADVASTSSVIGLTNGAIANGAIGYVTSQGTIDNVNTSTFTVGQVLYLSPYSAGQLMNTIPPTGITVQVGVVTFVNSLTGHIYVKQTTPLSIPASIISGTLGVDHGGTGATTLTGYVKGSGTSAMTASSTIPTTDLSGTITNAQLANSAITINGTSTSLGGSVSVGTVTSVTGTSPVVSSGGNTPAISMPAATTSVSGYLTSTDWNTFNGKGSGSVTSVALTAPSIFTVTGSPITSSGTLALTYSGTALPILNGGTGQTTANSAFNALVPSQTSNSGKYLTTNGTDTSWASLGNAYSRTSFTATAVQTTFTVSYTVGLIQVYVNGVFLNGADYTATNGTSVVLAVACNAGDIVEALAFTSFSVASTVSSFSAGTTGLTPSTGTTGNVTLGGTLAVANGGTGVTTKTGTGNVVLSTSPVLTTPSITSGSLTMSDSTTITSGSQVAKAWGSYAYAAVGSTPTLKKAYNISSITRNSTGNYTFAFTNALADANYSVVSVGTYTLSANSSPLAWPYTRTTSNFVMVVGYANAGAITAYDFGCDFAIFD
jgi:hypothetical protein